MDSTPRVGAQAPLDDQGRLLHEDDLAAQLALAFHNLEDALGRLGRGACDLGRLRVRTCDAAALTEVLDVLTDRLAELGIRPTLVIEEVDATELVVPGLLVTIEPLAGPTTPRPPRQPRAFHPPLQPDRQHSREGSVMTMPSPQIHAQTPMHSPAEALRGLCGGRVHLPGDAAYDVARVPWNVAVDQRPAAVAVPHTVQEVAEVVRGAADAGLRIAPQSSGHGAPALAESDLGDVVLVRLTELTGVTVDPATRTARVLGGTLWADVAAATAPHGLVALHGSSPDVAVAGYTLGGGLSFYGRRHGLAAHTVVAAEVVTADGELVRTDATERPELLWALRGGGGNLGVVVALELALLPVTDVYAGMLLFDRERAPEVLRAWTEWTREVPDSVTTSLRVMSFPPLPELPPFLSGRQLVVIDGAVLEDDARAAELLSPLRDLGPEMDTFGRIPATGLLGVHMDPPRPTPAVATHAVLGRLDEHAVGALLSEVGPGTMSPLMFAELRHLGGALARPGDGALSHLEGDYALFCVAVAPTPEAAAHGLAAGRALVATMSPWATGGQLLNFSDQRVDPVSAYPGGTLDRLRRVREELDPARRLLANHGVE